MSWTQCEKGHSYDEAEHTDGCPNCGQEVKAKKATVIHNPPPTFVAQENALKDPKSNKTKMVRIGKSGSESGSTEVEDSLDPVVGWLVCVKGKDIGKDFRVKSGWSSIGRDVSMDICIPSDDTVSREEHAKVLYDIQNHKFYLAPGSGRNPVYLNSTPLLQASELNAYDRIELGNTQLSFIPFCSDKFNW